MELGKVCKKITDGTHEGPKFIDSGIPFLLVSNIKNGKINYSTNKFISREQYLKFTKSTSIEKGDILYTSVGSYGNSAIVETDNEFCFQRHIAHLKPNHENIDVSFLNVQLQTDFIKKQADRLAIGVAQKTLNLKAIKIIQIIFPTKKIQIEFSKRILALNNSKFIVQQCLKRSEELFQSLLQKAFKGEL